MGRVLAESYQSNLKLGGSHFNAVTISVNPAYMAMSGFNEMVTGLGMDAHDLGQQLTGWGRARALGKGLVGAVGTVAVGAGGAAAFSASVGRVGVQSTTQNAVSFGTRFQRFFYDNRPYSKIGPEYWQKPYGPAGGRFGSSLDHWLFSRTNTAIPQGIRNAGFNMIELPGVIRTPVGGLNQWMGLSNSSWAPVARFGVSASIPGSLAGGFWGGMEFGEWFFSAGGVP
jgi:hypothetical protein